MANTANRLAGTAYVTVDGISIMVVGEHALINYTIE